MKGKSAVSWLCQPKSALVDSNLDAAVADRVRPCVPHGSRTPASSRTVKPKRGETRALTLSRAHSHSLLPLSRSLTSPEVEEHHAVTTTKLRR